MLLLWMTIIYIASDQPSLRVPSFGSWDAILKKGGHLLAYSVLAFLAYRVTATWSKPFLAAFVIAGLYAVGDEWHQSFVPGRNGTTIDVLIDCLGATMMLLVLKRGRRRHSRGWT
jgi:VanZ family protein